MNKEFYNIFQLLFFNPDKQRGWNFYTWNYKPELTIDLSLSFYHRIIVSDIMHAYYINPKLWYIYVFQYEIYYKKAIVNHNTHYAYSIGNWTIQPYSVSYLIAQAVPDYYYDFHLEPIWLIKDAYPL